MTQSFDRYPYLKTPNCEQGQAVVVEPTDAELGALARQHGTGGWQSLSDMVRFARAVLAIKPQPKVINKD